MNRPRRLRRIVTGNPARKRELFEQPFHALFILLNVRPKLAVGPFEIGVRDQSGAAMAGARDVDHIQIVFLDHAIEVRVYKIQPRRGSEMPQQPRFNVLHFERLAQHGVFVEINLSDRKIVSGAPIGIDLRKLFLRQRLVRDAGQGIQSCHDSTSL